MSLATVKSFVVETASLEAHGKLPAYMLQSWQAELECKRCPQPRPHQRNVDLDHFADRLEQEMRLL